MSVSKARWPGLLPALILALWLAPAAAAESPALKRVLLSTGGVGYFEFEARVNGTAELALPLELDQVDDVLKSIVVFDDKGGTGTISLPSRLPESAFFRELPFEADALASASTLLGAIKGADVVIVGRRRAEGRIVSVAAEPRLRPDGEMGAGHVVTLLGPRGLELVSLEEARTVSFRDRRLQRAFDRALEDLALRGSDAARTLTITAIGAGERTLTIGYVVAAPLWKSAYRLVLPASSSEAGVPARLQGWAILENASGHDWHDVALTLASGNPVTFRQALYEAYYVERPEVPVEVLGRILPRPDEGDLRKREAAAPRATLSAPVFSAPVFADGLAAEERLDAAARPAPLATAQEAASQVLFTLDKPVSVGRGQSLAVPIVDQAISAERLAVFQRATHARHPLAAVMLKNETGTSLPAGVLTLYEASAAGRGHAFVGDAQMRALAPGDERFLAFALDEKTLVDARDERRRRIERGTIAGGILRISVVERQITDYVLRAPAGEPRRLVIEHPRAPGWQLVAPTGADIKQAADAYRLPVAIEAGREVTLRVVLEQPIAEELALVDLDSERLAAYLGGEELDPALRAIFEAVAERRAAVEAAADRLAALDAERSRIFEEQARIRDNLETLGEGDALRRRYLALLGTQEDRLAELDAAFREAEGRQRTALEALRAYVETLAL